MKGEKKRVITGEGEGGRKGSAWAPEGQAARGCIHGLNTVDRVLSCQMGSELEQTVAKHDTER